MDSVKITCWQEKPSGDESRIPPLLGDLGFELAFARPKLVHSPLLGDICVFAMRFDAQKISVPQQQLLFAHAVEALMGDDLEACLSLPGSMRRPLQKTGDESICEYVPLANWLVDHELMKRGLRYFELVLPEPISRLTGFYSRFFFECPKQLLHYTLQEYWDTIGGEVEGYVLDREAIPLLHEWNLHNRDAELFHKVMDTVHAAFRTFADREGILVITRNFDLEDLKRLVGCEA